VVGAGLVRSSYGVGVGVSYIIGRYLLFYRGGCIRSFTSEKKELKILDVLQA